MLKQEYGPLMTSLGVSLAQITLTQSLLSFADEIDRATQYARAFIEKVTENNAKLKKPYTPEQQTETIMAGLKKQLNQLPIFENANNFHIAVVASEDPVIKNWLNENIKKDTHQLTEATNKPYNITPLYLAHFLGKNDVIALFDKHNIKLGTLSPFQRDLLQAAIDGRKPEKKKIPSIPFQRTLRRDPKQYIQHIRRLVTNVLTDAKFSKTLQKEHPRFYAWLMAQGVEYIRQEKSS